MNANSEFKYASGFDKKYIDDIFKWWNQGYFGKYLPGNPPTIAGTGFQSLFWPKMIDYDKATESQNHVGDASIGIYTPVYDETNDRIINEIAVSGSKQIMITQECQPNLLYAMKWALSSMGYAADLSVLEHYPWSNIYIVNTGCILPHWTLERFITEFKAFFGLSLRFEGKMAIFGRIDYDAEAVSYQCLDEFTSEFDDEGIQANSTSNLQYKLRDSPEKTFYTEIPDEVMKAFTVREYASESEMWGAFPSLSDTEKAQSIFSTPTGYFYARTDSVTATGGNYNLVRAGQFNKLVRNKENDSADELGIVPVTMARMDVKFRKLVVEADSSGFWPTGGFKVDGQTDVSIIMPTAESEDPSTDDFATVQQALEDGEAAESKERPESDRMEVFFLGTGTKSFTGQGKTVKMAVVGTDPTIDEDFKDKISFALSRAKAGLVHVGQFHTGNIRLNGKNQKCIRFLCDEIPDPTRIYLFYNKRYVCEKIEISITADGIDKVKTGYFYEIIS